ncbi:MAG: FecR domain-containing protein [Verrucomicrobia bacterium]|nr:FecR domain-containing protein [Verrucomicrobiota bacterium]
MNPPDPHPAEGGDATLRDVATRWVVRQDRRLSEAETAEFEAWLAADPHHAAALADAEASWHFFRALGTTVRRAPVAPTRRNRAVATSLAAAAILALACVSLHRNSGPGPRAMNQQPAPPSAEAASRLLDDGSVVRLKDDARIEASFTAGERRIRLLGGEAFFIVARDESRPFYVEAGKVTVRAVGTAFAVRCAPRTVDVVVTEGVVRVSPPDATVASPPATASPVEPAVVRAGHRAIVARASIAGPAAPIAVTAISGEEIDRSLAWSGRMLELAGATLGELVAEFSRRSGRQLRLGDPALSSVQVGGRFPIDDVDGFVRALEEIYQVKCERQGDGLIILKLQ